MYPERIICLTEEYIELLYLLGEEKRIIGITTYTKRPSQAIKEKPIVTSFIKSNINKINELQPDLVLGFSDIQAEIARELVKNNHNVIITNQRTIGEIFQVMFWVSILVGRHDKYLLLMEKWKQKLHNYKEKAYNIINKINKKYKVLFLEWDNPIITGITWVEELLENLHVEICFPHLKTKKNAMERVVSIEDINKVNPDIIINSWCGKETDFDWIKNNFKDTNAVKENRIYEVAPEIILQPGPALFEEGIDILYKCIYKNDD